MNSTVQRRRVLSPRSKRAVAAALLAIVVLIPLAAIAAGAWFAHRHYDDAIAKMTRQLKSQTAMNATRPQVLQAVEVLREKDTKRFFLKTGTAALVSAEFQESIRALIETNGGRVNQSQPLPAKEVDGYRQIGATFQVGASHANMQKILYAIEQKEPFAFVDSMTLRSNWYPGFKPAPGQPEPEHFLQLDVIGFAPLAPETPATAAVGSSPAKTNAPAGASALSAANPPAGAPAGATPPTKPSGAKS
jgi:Type II secretion system (T2SS), protein M subtype b